MVNRKVRSSSARVRTSTPLRTTSARLQRQTGREIGLRQDLADRDVELGEKDELLRHQENLGREADHRLMNALQTVVSLLSLQSRAAENPEAAKQLTIAANRVAMIARVHRRLHSFDGVEVVVFKKYIEDLCHDFAVMLSPHGKPEQSIVVEAPNSRSRARRAFRWASSSAS